MFHTLRSAVNMSLVKCSPGATGVQMRKKPFFFIDGWSQTVNNKTYSLLSVGSVEVGETRNAAFRSSGTYPIPGNGYAHSVNELSEALAYERHVSDATRDLFYDRFCSSVKDEIREVHQM